MGEGAEKLPANEHLSDRPRLTGSDHEIATRERSDACPSPSVAASIPQDRRQLESRAEAQPQPQESLQDMLQSWKNPVFEPVEPRIPTLYQAPRAERAANVTSDGPASKFYSHGSDVQFDTATMALNGRLSRSALAEAEMIGQVDRKFLLLQLPLHTSKAALSTEASSALIMLDQHAADERCRLEELMSQYFENDAARAVTEVLERPIVFEVSAREWQLVTRLQSHFQTWGIVCRTSGQRCRHEIEITSLPPSILERCRAEPKLLIDLVRKEIWKLEDRNPPRRPVHEQGRRWVSNFHNCPQGILELLHSRACRSKLHRVGVYHMFAV
jgi:DNA mismatch repair protein MLH3